MKYKINFIIIIALIARVFAVGEAGAVFLLINPGSKAAGTGEAQVAKADDAYASYYNPAGLGFLRGREVVMQHVNWLPNLTSDIFYDFLAYRKSVAGLGTFGGHIIFLNLGTQQGMDEWERSTGEFKSYMAALNFSYGTQIAENKAVGMNFKVFHQKLSDEAQAGETGDPFSTDFGFDIGYLQKFGKRNQHQFGFSIQNIGPPIDFIDAQQADPAPTNMRLGVYAEVFKSEQNKINFLFDANKLLVASYPSMDWDGDGIISGSKEKAHSDPWYKGVFTAWLDDWYYGGDYDLCENPCGNSSVDYDVAHAYGSTRDGRIGGYFVLPGYTYLDNDNFYNIPKKDQLFRELEDKEGDYQDYYSGTTLYSQDVSSSGTVTTNTYGEAYFSTIIHEEWNVCPDGLEWGEYNEEFGQYEYGNHCNGTSAFLFPEQEFINGQGFVNHDFWDTDFNERADWIDHEMVYPSYTKIYQNQLNSITIDDPFIGNLNSLDFLIKHFPDDVEDALKPRTENIFIPNYQGFCEELYSPAGGTFFADGKPIKPDENSQVFGYSMCYSQENADDTIYGNEIDHSYYTYKNLGGFSDPDWIRAKNPAFEMSELAFLDLPHDGMGAFDKFDWSCVDDDDPSNCNAYYKGQIVVQDAHTVEDDPADFCSPGTDTNGDGWICGPGDNGITDDELSLVHEQGDITPERGQFYYDIEIYENTIIDKYGEGLYQYFGEKSFDDPRYGVYNPHGNLEKGSGEEREFKNELEEMIYNFGLEWSYTDNFIMRLGFIYDLEGDIKNPTFGAGINFDKYGFDFGYTAGEKGHPRENTMFFSLSLGL